MDEKKEKTSFAPAKTQRASEVVYQQIYEKIVSGELKTGDRLPAERVLAEQFKRSRNIIREALRMLQQDNLVEIEVGSQGGTIVKGISTTTVEEPLRKMLNTGAISLEKLVEYRHINDHGCARLAAIHHTDDDIAKIREILDEAKENIDNPQSFEEFDVSFHRALAEAGHNEFAIIINNIIVELNTKLMADVTQNYTREQQTEVNRKVYESHYAIFQAVEEGDQQKADRSVDFMVDLFNQEIHHQNG